MTITAWALAWAVSGVPGILIWMSIFGELTVAALLGGLAFGPFWSLTGVITLVMESEVPNPLAFRIWKRRDK